MKVETVDSYQGQQNNIVLIDIVIAHLHSKYTGIQADPEDKAKEDVNDDGSENYVYGKVISQHARDAHRLCTAITRGRDGVGIWCKGADLLSTFKLKQTREKAALSELYKDAKERNFVFIDTETFDDSPQGKDIMAKFTESEKKIFTSLEDKKRLQYLDLSFSRAAPMKQQDDQERPRYRTSKQITTEVFSISQKAAAENAAAVARTVEEVRNDPSAAPVYVIPMSQKERRQQMQNRPQQTQQESQQPKRSWADDVEEEIEGKMDVDSPWDGSKKRRVGPPERESTWGR